MLPKDPHILLSTVNTKLRDFHDSLEDLCKSHDIDINDLKEILASIDYHFNETLNQFK